MTSFGLIAAGTVIMPLMNFMPDGNWIQVYAWGTLILFLLVPVVAMILWLVRIISGVKKRNQYISYTLGTLWTLGWVSVIMLAASITKQFKRSGQIRNDVGIVQPTTGNMRVEFKDAEGKYYPMDLNFNFGDRDDESESEIRLSVAEDSFLIGNISVRLAKSIDSNYHVSTIKRARASSSKEAEEVAEQISFPVSQADSILNVPVSFPISTKTKFRNQHVRLEIEVPVGKEIYISPRANNLMSYSLRTNKDGLTVDWDEYENDNNLWRPGIWYIMTERGVEKKYKDQFDDQEDQDRSERKSRSKDRDNSDDQLKMKIEKELEEHTSISKKIEYPAEQDVETTSSNVGAFQAGRILFSALSLLRIGG